MDLVLTEAEYAALPENRQTGEQQKDGTFRIALQLDPWVAIDAANNDRDAMQTGRDRLKAEHERAWKLAESTGTRTRPWNEPSSGDPSGSIATTIPNPIAPTPDQSSPLRLRVALVVASRTSESPVRKLIRTHCVGRFWYVWTL